MSSVVAPCYILVGQTGGRGSGVGAQGVRQLHHGQVIYDLFWVPQRVQLEPAHFPPFPLAARLVTTVKSWNMKWIFEEILNKLVKREVVGEEGSCKRAIIFRPMWTWQCCGSVPGPGSWFLPISYPGSQNSNKGRGEKNLLSYLFM